MDGLPLPNAIDRKSTKGATRNLEAVCLCSDKLWVPGRVPKEYVEAMRVCQKGKILVK